MRYLLRFNADKIITTEQGMMMKFTTLIFTLLMSMQIFTALAQSEFKVSLLRAAPGKMPELLSQASDYRQNNKGEVLLMRHSQGDHWDLMMIEPMTEKITESQRYNDIAAFEHQFLVRSAWSWQDIKARAKYAGLFHIEMFHAAVGKKAQLLKQRQMENSYYNATKRDGNIIFETVFGHDMDNFTLGFYKDMKTFATDPDLPNEVFEKAATDAGFTSRSDIGLYLREFISRHYDTLAVPLK